VPGEVEASLTALTSRTDSGRLEGGVTRGLPSNLAGASPALVAEE